MLEGELRALPDAVRTEAGLGVAKLKADVTAALHNAIVTGHLLPNERLVEVDLAARFQTTRARVRSGLGTLESEGLVTSEPNRGARVRFVTGAEAIEISEARAALETLLAAKAAARATPDDIAGLDAILVRMRAAAAAGDLIGYSALNGELHQEIRRIARHPTVSKLLVVLNASLARFRFRAILIPGRAARSLAEHEAIVEAISARDPNAAQSAMAGHLRHVVDALQRAIAAQEEPLGAVVPGVAGVAAQAKAKGG
jgi:DNA-binding GntR family transcriptional regulator